MGAQSVLSAQFGIDLSNVSNPFQVTASPTLQWIGANQIGSEAAEAIYVGDPNQASWITRHLHVCRTGEAAPEEFVFVGKFRDENRNIYWVFEVPVQ